METLQLCTAENYDNELIFKDIYTNIDQDQFSILQDMADSKTIDEIDLFLRDNAREGIKADKVSFLLIQDKENDTYHLHEVNYDDYKVILDDDIFIHNSPQNTYQEILVTMEIQNVLCPENENNTTFAYNGRCYEVLYSVFFDKFKEIITNLKNLGYDLSDV